MGFKNAGEQFQSMIEWLFKDTPSFEPSINGDIIGSTGAEVEESVAN